MASLSFDDDPIPLQLGRAAKERRTGSAMDLEFVRHASGHPSRKPRWSTVGGQQKNGGPGSRLIGFWFIRRAGQEKVPTYPRSWRGFVCA